jgi:hypothetical protein
MVRRIERETEEKGNGIKDRSRGCFLGWSPFGQQKPWPNIHCLGIVEDG